MWKKFNFFTSELLQTESPTSNLYALQAMDITCVTGGNGQLVFCDSEGGITICNQDYSLHRFKAHKGCINFAYLYKSSNILLTVASPYDLRSEATISQSCAIANSFRKSLYSNPKYNDMMKNLGLAETVTPCDSTVENEVKIWRMGSLDEDKNPTCCRTFQFFPSSSTEVITCLAVNEENEVLAIGCQSGSIYLIKGNIIRSKYTQPIFLTPAQPTTIISLCFAESSIDHSLLLYLTSTSQIGVFSLTKKSFTFTCLDKEHGCAKNCSCITEKGEFIVGRDDGLFRFYNGEENGCYAIEGNKQVIGSFKDCLLVSVLTPDKQQNITIYNNEAHFIEYHGIVARNNQTELVNLVFTEWGDLFILTQQHSVFCFHKVDLQTKLEVFYKEKLFSLALKVAQQNNLYYQDIADIHKKYADYLYKENNYEEAINEYIKTIGYIEPSYVIRKFLDAQHLPQLTSYLEALHEQGLANSEHTTFLLKCYSKLKEKEKLKAFVRNEKNNLKYDIVTAITVLDSCDCDEEALFLAKTHNYYREYLSILIKKKHQYEEAVKMIHYLSFNQADSAIQEFGPILLDHQPELTVALITDMCIDYQQLNDEKEPEEEPEEEPEKPSPKPTLSLRESIRKSFRLKKATTTNSSIVTSAPAILATLGEKVLEPVFGDPSHYIYLFSSHPDLLKQFLKQVLQRPQECDQSAWNTYLELVLREEQRLGSEVAYEEESEVMKILSNPHANYDEEEALILVQTYNCFEGQLFLYKKLKMYSLLLEYYVYHNDSQNAIALCKQVEDTDSNLWIQLLTILSQAETINVELIQEILDYIEKNQVVPLLYALQILSQNDHIQLQVVRKYILHHIQRLKGTTALNNEKTEDVSISNQGLKRELTSLVKGARLFQNTKCCNCSLPLELPVIHYVCGHSYHKGCLVDSANGCTRCAYKFKSYLSLPPAPTEEEYFDAMKKNKDGFEVTADFFGKRMFSNLEEQNKKEKRVISG